MAGRKALVAMVVAASIAAVSCQRIPRPGTGTPTFEDRRAQVLAAIAQQDVGDRIGAKHTYWVAQAKLAAGDFADGMDVLRATLANRSGAMFRMWALADTYGRWRHVMDADMKASAEEQLVLYGYYDGGSTINHRLMYATARYLGSSYFPDRDFRSDFRADDPNARQYLRGEMADLARFGIPEFDSPGYSALYLSVAQSLADLAPDADVRGEARLALDSMLRSLAGEWLDGHLLSGSLRNAGAADGQGDFAGGDYILWLYTGGDFDPDLSASAIEEEAGLVHAVVHSIGNYISPLATLEQIGQERTQRSYTHYDTDVWGHRRYYQTAFANRTYGLFSTYESYDIHTGYSKQFHRWGVRWSSPNDVSTFYLKHPHQHSGTEGTTGYEKVVQCGGTLLGFYDVPASYPVQHAEGFVPAEAAAVIDQSDRGALYLHYGSVLIGLRATGSLDWDPGATTLRLPDPQAGAAGFQAGFVVETARPGEYTGTESQQLAAFRQDVERNDLVVSGDRTRLSYVARGGAALEITAAGERSVNGDVVDLDTWPLVADPWVDQRLGSPTPGGAGEPAAGTCE